MGLRDAQKMSIEPFVISWEQELIRSRKIAKKPSVSRW